MSDLLPKNLCSFIWFFLKPYKRVVVIFILISILAGLWAPFNSMLIKSIINHLTSQLKISQLTWSALLLALNFFVFGNITWRLIAFLNFKFQPVIKNQIISQTFSFVLGSSHQFFLNNLSGRISNQIINIADNVERILHRISPDLIRGISLLIVTCVSMYYVNPVFFYTLIIWVFTFALLSMYMSKQLVHLSDRHAESESMIAGHLVDSITNVNNVRTFARNKYEMLRLEDPLNLAKNKFQKKELFIIIFNFFQGLLIAAMIGIMAYFLINFYDKKIITIGDFALILGLSLEIAFISWYTMGIIDEFNQAVGKCKQSLNALIIPYDLIDKKDASNLLATKGQIVFSGVKFHYKDSQALFQNKSIIVESGQKVGLVGYSGSGKSTFVNLILRLYDVIDGYILIDGQDIRTVSQDSLRQNISFIPQDPTLFHRSLMENIRYGRIEASDKEVFEAAKKAHAHEFIRKLPQGYESLVGERGIKLSGGQRQRIAIARAILKNAPILILDEATSQLDSITESNIQESLRELMRGKTTIVIAHRLSTLLHMNRIIVFDQGKIVDDGSHVELLKKGGLYKSLWDAQIAGFLPYKKQEDEQAHSRAHSVV